MAYAINPAARYSPRPLYPSAALVYHTLSETPGTVDDLARRLRRDRLVVWFDLEWLKQHAFVRPARQTHD